MTKQVPFHVLLRSERERAGLSLRGLAERAHLNPGSLSRMEAGAIVPRLPMVLQLAEALADARGLEASKRDALLARFLTAANRSPDATQTLGDLRERFSAMLREHGLDAGSIEIALQEVPPSTMLRVVRGEEPLELRHASELARANHGINLDQQVVVLPLRPLTFSAGPRAQITVNGPMTPLQQQQIRLAAKLIGLMLNDGDSDASAE
jgi:transcriptional regulator with XRE-family HTH domain